MSSKLIKIQLLEENPFYKFANNPEERGRHRDDGGGGGGGGGRHPSVPPLRPKENLNTLLIAYRR